MSEVILRRWKFHTRASLVALFVLQALVGVLLVRWIVGMTHMDAPGVGSIACIVLAMVVYVVVMITTGTHKWYLVNRRGLVLKDLAVSAVPAVVSGFVCRNVLVGVAAYVVVNIVFVLWTFLAEFWLHRQIEPLWTLVLTGDETDPEFLSRWIEGHKRIYDKAKECDVDNLGKAEEMIDMYKIPLILTAVEPSDELLELARRKGVMVHYANESMVKAPRGFFAVDRYKGLFVME